MNTLTFNFRTTEEILSSSPVDLVSTIAVSAAIPLRRVAGFVAKRPGANGFAVVTASTAH
ncbi:hypothetical protein [Rhizobium sp. C1]|uniref:hypothetical protein n=1 Tax=Rhizobium sp. C1 TaxID=1349799 RepID=UPI001E2F8232|nr:hypothetical protein [Rhizobium sp. C1]